MEGTGSHCWLADTNRHTAATVLPSTTPPETHTHADSDWNKRTKVMWKAAESLINAAT